MEDWYGLEAACLEQRTRALGATSQKRSSSPLSSIFLSLLELPEIGALLQRAALEPELRSENVDFRQKLIHWLLSHLPSLDQDLINQATPLLSEIAGIPLFIRCKPKKIQQTNYRLETDFYEIVGGSDASSHPDTCSLEPSTVPVSHMEAKPLGFEWESDYQNADNPNDRQTKLLELLDNLARKVILGHSKQLADMELSALRLAAESHNNTITPVFWNFSESFSFRNLTPDQISKARKPFVQDRPLGDITQLTSFGLESNGNVCREPALQISLGPKIPGMDGCLGIIRSLTGPEIEPVRSEMANWPNYILQGTFRDKLRQFYVDLHGKFGDAWRVKNTDSFNRFREFLIEVVQSYCKFRAFFPRHRNQYDQHFIQLVGNNAPRTGNVVRVLMPGLLDDQNCLILPAQVEVD